MLKVFFFLLDRVQEDPGEEDTRVKEYGVDFDNRFIEAFSLLRLRAIFLSLQENLSLMSFFGE
jgi:hypothetical protein